MPPITYYIAKRCYPKQFHSYTQLFKSVVFDEIVTLDLLLCKKKIMYVNERMVIAERDTYEQICAFPVDVDEQIIRHVNIKNEDFLTVEEGFEFCGYDILDHFEVNSWLTNYDFSYDLSPQKYTKYGLLQDIVAVMEWIDKHKGDDGDIDDEFRQGTYEIFKVWRKTVKRLTN